MIGTSTAGIQSEARDAAPAFASPVRRRRWPSTPVRRSAFARFPTPSEQRRDRRRSSRSRCRAAREATSAPTPEKPRIDQQRQTPGPNLRPRRRVPRQTRTDRCASRTARTDVACKAPGTDAPALRVLIASPARSQSDTCAGCIVSATTALSSPLSASSSTSSRSRAPKRSSVRAASYLLRKKRRSTSRLDPRSRRAEQRGDRERRAGDRQAGVAGEPLSSELQQQHAAEVDGGRASPSAHRRPACG